MDAHPSFGIKAGTVKKPKSFYKCMSCGMGGDLMDLAIDLKQYLDKSPADGYKLGEAMKLIAEEQAAMELSAAGIPDYEDKPEDEQVPFPEEWLATFQPIEKFEVALDYCHGRGLSLELLKALDVRYDPIQKRVCFPYRDRTGKLMGVQGRSLDVNTTLRYYQYGYHDHRNAHVWMGEDKVDLDKPVVMLEGPFDLASVYRVYTNVVASFTSGLSFRKLDRLKDVEEIITFYDYGKGGNAAREKIRKHYKKARVVDIVPTEQEDDAGNLTEEVIAAYLSNHVSL
jgi:DNA primase